MADPSSVLSALPGALPTAVDPEASLRFRAYLAKALEEFDRVTALHAQAVDEIRSMQEQLAARRVTGAVPNPPSACEAEISAQADAGPPRSKKTADLDDSKHRRTALQGFYHVCQEGQEVLTPLNLHNLILKQNGEEDVDAAGDEHQVQVIGEALRAFNETTQPTYGHEQKAELGLHGYTTLVQMDEETLKCIMNDPTISATLVRIRSCLQAANNLQKMQIELQAAESKLDLAGEEKQTGRFAAFVSNWLDPIIGLVIVLNALTIGLGLDIEPDWVGWLVIEATFTFIFCVEVGLKISVFGFWNHFLGKDWAWSLFEALIITTALVDHVVEVFTRSVNGRNSGLNAVTALRLLRFLRLSKLGRVLRLKIFKELNLLVTGFTMGLKTLLFAICFLGFVIYCMAVMLRFTIGDPLPCEQDGTCTDPSEAHFQRWRPELFGSVPKAMFTVFRCFTDGCASLDGTPLIPYVWDVYGTAALFFYVFFTLLVIFGLFNLIAAIFVENTLENSKMDDDKRQALKVREHMRTAYRLQQCITRIALDMDEDGNLRGHSADLKQKPAPGLLGFFSTNQPVSLAKEHGCHSKRRVSITPKMLDALLHCSEVRALVEDLDINLSACRLIYDVLDSDGSRSLDVCEVVQGIMKLQESSKHGSVETLLTVRTLQKTMRNVELVTMSQQKAVAHLRKHQDNLEKWVLPPGLRSALSADEQRALDLVLAEVDQVVAEELAVVRKLTREATFCAAPSADDSSLATTQLEATV